MFLSAKKNLLEVANLEGAFSTLGQRCEEKTACRASLSWK